MPAAIGTERFLLIGVASPLHAKAIGTLLIHDEKVGRRFISHNFSRSRDSGTHTYAVLTRQSLLLPMCG